MAKGGISIVEQENRRKKAKELKRAKEQRQKEKLERLSQVDPKRLRRRIHDLESKKERSNGRLLINEQRQLDSLTKDLEFITKKNLSLFDEETSQKADTKQEIEEKPVELGIKSIFWDPEWNPLGIAPKGHKNIAYPLRQPHKYEIDPEVAKIPIPKSPPPRFFKIQQSQSVYESAPEVQKTIPQASGSATRFIPSTVRNTQRVTQSTTTGAAQDEEQEYASEEEEALGIKRKADEIDDY